MREAVQIATEIDEVPTPIPVEGTGVPPFDEIYRLYGGKVLNLAMRMTQDEQAARDLTQDIFLKVYQSLPGFRQDAQLYTWIYRIASNHILSHLRRQKRVRWERFMEAPLGDLISDHDAASPASAPSDAPLPDALLEREERQEIVRNALGKLPPKYRLPYILFHFEGMRYDEIAESLNLNMSTVQIRIHRAKGKMIEQLRPWAGKI